MCSTHAHTDSSPCCIQVTPTSLTFGLDSGKAPVYTWMKQELTLKNSNAFDINTFVAIESSWKFEVKVSHPEPFLLRAGTEEKVTIGIRILCTTTLKTKLSILFCKNGEDEFNELAIPFETESLPSTRLDSGLFEVEREHRRSGGK